MPDLPTPDVGGINPISALDDREMAEGWACRLYESHARWQVVQTICDLLERAERAERESGQWEARFMDEQAARRLAELEREHNSPSLLANLAEHWRVRREVAAELRKRALRLDDAKLLGLAARLDPGSERA